MKSYNCFYSALFDMLEPKYQENTALLINNRWQFFYNTNNDYSDDRRIIGEYPLPFDNVHLKKLFDMCNIDIQIFNAEMGLDQLYEFFYKNKFAIVFVNRNNLRKNLDVPPNGRCVTTIRINELRSDYVSYSTFDDDTPIIEMDSIYLFESWRNASDFSFLNKTIVNINHLPAENSETAIRSFFWNNIASSVNGYFTETAIDGVIYGHTGLEIFAQDLHEGKIDTFQKLVDCSKYIEFIIKQREAVSIILSERQYHLRSSIDFASLDAIVDMWKKVKIFFFIIGKREQYESIKFISDQIRAIAEMEYIWLTDLMKVAGDNI